MNTQRCNFCKRDKKESDFYPYSKKKCKECHREYYLNNKDRILNKHKEVYYADLEETRRKQRDWWNKNRTIQNEKSKQRYHSLSPGEKKIRNHKQAELVKNDPIKHAKKLAINKRYREKNKDIIKEKRRLRVNRKYHTDIEYKLKHLLKCRLYKSITREQKTKSALKLVGCTSTFLKNYLESLFKPEMNWGNYGVLWEVDHIIPIAYFNLSNPEEQQKCFHYTNLQPLFKTTELAKKHGYDEIGNLNKSRKIIQLNTKVNSLPPN